MVKTKRLIKTIIFQLQLVLVLLWPEEKETLDPVITYHQPLIL